MKDLNQSSSAEASTTECPVNRYFSKTNFAQIPNAMFLYSMEEGEPFDLVVYAFLYSACFNRRKGDFNTKFNVSSIAECLKSDMDTVKTSLRRLIKSKHIKQTHVKKIENGDVYLELWLSTRVQGFKKFIQDEPVG